MNTIVSGYYNMPRRFLLVRHGQSIWNKDSKFTGWTNIPLTQKGRDEAATIAKTLISLDLVPNIVFSSVLDRAIETSAIIKHHLSMNDMPVHTSWRLNEKHYGTLEGVPRKYIREIYGDLFTRLMRSDFYMKPPVLASDVLAKSTYPVYRNCYFESIQNGESKENVLHRLLPYYENDIVYPIYHENRFPLIVTHKHTARVLMKHLLRMDDVAFEKYDLPSKTILCVTLGENQVYSGHDEIAY
jgi:2,3-bisphosphoglycerate-dependent phosphoglycerate mutase